MRIASRFAAPQELGLARDPRSLGVALREIAVRQGSRLLVAGADDDRLVSGFDGFEADNGFIWTDGDAEIPAEMLAMPGPCTIVLQVASTARYIEDGEVLRVA